MVHPVEVAEKGRPGGDSKDSAASMPHSHSGYTTFKHSSSVSPPIKQSTDNLSCSLAQKVPGTQHALHGTRVIVSLCLGR